MIVARHHQHATPGRGAIGVAMAQRVARAIDAGALAIPHREHALDLGTFLEMGLLGAEHGGGAHVLVDRRHEVDAVLLEQGPGAPHLEIDPAEGRAAIAGNEAGGVPAPGRMAAGLVEHDACEGLGAGEEDAALRAGVTVLEPVTGQGAIMA